MIEDTETPVPQSIRWSECYSGGSAEAELAEFQQLAHAIMAVQTATRKKISSHDAPHPIQRAFHAKATLAVDDAVLRFGELPEDLQVGPALPRASYPTTVRFSNAAGSGAPDFARDMRGIALRVQISDTESIDLLATNYPVSHARNARQFVEFATATAGGRISQLFGIARLVKAVGPCETVRMFRNVSAARKQPVASVASQTYWSRGALTWGPEVAVRYDTCCGRRRARQWAPSRQRPTRAI